MRLPVERNPNFMRFLRGEAMELKSGEKADYTTRRLFGSHCQAVVLGDGRAGKEVDPAAGSAQDSAAIKAQKSLAGNPAGLDVPGADDPLPAGDLQDFCVAERMLLSIGSFAYLPGFCNIQNCPMHDEPERKGRFQCGMSLKRGFDSNAG